VAVDGSHLHVELPPSSAIKLRLGMRRYVNLPSYTQPLK
jgi:hypothetical protein